MIKISPDQQKILDLDPANSERLQGVIDEEVGAMQRRMFLGRFEGVTKPVSLDQFAQIDAILEPSKA